MRVLRVGRFTLCFCVLASIAAYVERSPAAAASAQGAAQPSPYLFAWASSADTSQPDFLAVIDALPSSPTYGDVITTVSTGIPVNLAHHTDYEMPPGGVLFANDYTSGLTFRFDLHNPRSPKLLGVFGAAGPYTHPHSFVHLPNGRVLYRITGLDGYDPAASLIYDFGGSNCAVPVVAGHYWIQPVWTVHAHIAVYFSAGKPHFVRLGGKNCCRDEGTVVALDISDLSKPVEAGRLTLGPKDFPPWLSLEPDGQRLVLTGYQGLQNQIVIINLGKNGQLSIDPRFHNSLAGPEPGIRLESKHWPHGGSGPAIPHGVVFSLP